MKEDLYSDISADLSENTLETEAHEPTDTVLREEYEALIGGKYKKFYTEDTQKMINKRFRKYKDLEEKIKTLEDERSGFEQRLKAEKEQSAKQAEEALMASIKSRYSRPDENGIFGIRAQSKRDVSSLSRTERAEMARRASKGEKIII